MVSLKQIKAALVSLGAEDKHIDRAVAELANLLIELDEVQVKGRQQVDTLLGCMMALESIIGEGKNGG